MSHLETGASIPVFSQVWVMYTFVNDHDKKEKAGRYWCVNPADLQTLRQTISGIFVEQGLARYARSQNPC